MQTLIKEVENQIRNREDNLRYSRDDVSRQAIRINEDEETLATLKKELEVLKQGK